MGGAESDAQRAAAGRIRIVEAEVLISNETVFDTTREPLELHVIANGDGPAPARTQTQKQSQSQMQYVT